MSDAHTPLSVPESICVLFNRWNGLDTILSISSRVFPRNSGWDLTKFLSRRSKREVVLRSILLRYYMPSFRKSARAEVWVLVFPNVASRILKYVSMRNRLRTVFFAAISDSRASLRISAIFHSCNVILICHKVYTNTTRKTTWQVQGRWYNVRRLWVQYFES